MPEMNAVCFPSVPLQRASHVATGVAMALNRRVSIAAAAIGPDGTEAIMPGSMSTTSLAISKYPREARRQAAEAPLQPSNGRKWPLIRLTRRRNMP